MSNYNIRTFSNGPNKMRSADDYINRKKATTLYTVAASNTSSRAKNSNIPVKTTNLVGNPKLASVGGYNVNSYDLLMNISKGRYYVAPEGRYAELLNNPLFTSDISNNIKINDCSNTLINTKTTIQTPINQTWDLYEGSYLIDKDESISEWCKCTPNKLSKNRDLQIDSRLIYNNNALPQSSPSQIFFNGGARSVARWNNSDKLRGFSYPKIFCIPFSNNNNNNPEGALVFSVTGGAKTTSGDYTFHTFTSNDNLMVSIISGDPTSEIDIFYLIVGGGGGGGRGGAGDEAGTNRPTSGAGGGGGEVKTGSMTVGIGTYSTVIGGGGTAGGENPNGGKGGDSSFDIINATGGNGGQGKVNVHDGGDGGASGGGTPGGFGGIGTIEGYDWAGGGGGGGAGGAPGIVPNDGGGGDGGAGISGLAPFSGTYGGGGGGAYAAEGGPTKPRGLGGTGGGGDGGKGVGGILNQFATAGTANLGGGGGGGGFGGGQYDMPGGAGGSGVVIIAYLTSYTV